MTPGNPDKPTAGGLSRGRADDRDDSSKTTPATDMQADDAISPNLSGDLGGDGTPADRGQAQRDPHVLDRPDPQRRERGPSQSRARSAMKQEGRLPDDR